MKKQSEETKIKKRIEKAEADLHALHRPAPQRKAKLAHWLNRGSQLGSYYTGMAAIVGPKLNPTSFCVYMTIMNGYTVMDEDGKVLSAMEALDIKDPTKEL